jgi:hypothetical protein
VARERGLVHTADQQKDAEDGAGRLRFSCRRCLNIVLRCARRLMPFYETVGRWLQEVWKSYISTINAECRLVASILNP